MNVFVASVTMSYQWLALTVRSGDRRKAFARHAAERIEFGEHQPVVVDGADLVRDAREERRHAVGVGMRRAAPHGLEEILAQHLVPVAGHAIGARLLERTRRALAPDRTRPSLTCVLADDADPHLRRIERQLAESLRGMASRDEQARRAPTTPAPAARDRDAPRVRSTWR